MYYRKLLTLLMAVLVLACGAAQADKDSDQPEPAFLSTAEFLKTLDENGVKYSLSGGTNTLEGVTIQFVDDTDAGMPDFEVFFAFNADNTHISLRVFGLKEVPAEKRAAAFEACNTLNETYKYTCFYVDSDSEITVKIDYYVPTLTDVGPVCLEMLIRTVNIVQEGWSTIAAALG